MELKIIVSQSEWIIIILEIKYLQLLCVVSKESVISTSGEDVNYLQNGAIQILIISSQVETSSFENYVAFENVDELECFALQFVKVDISKVVANAPLAVWLDVSSSGTPERHLELGK